MLNLTPSSLMVTFTSWLTDPISYILLLLYASSRDASTIDGRCFDLFDQAYCKHWMPKLIYCEKCVRGLRF